MTDIQIRNEHTFNNWGTFDIVHDGIEYPAKWIHRGNTKTLETDAPETVYNRVYDYLFNEEF